MANCGYIIINYFETNETPLKELLCFSIDIEIIVNLTGCLLKVQDSDSVM